MPYAPGIEYVGDRYWNQAITGLGEQAAGAIKEYRRTRDESRALDSSMEAMVQGMQVIAPKARLDPETLKELGDLGKFSGLSLPQKRAKFGQTAATFKMLLDQTAAEQKAQAEAEAQRTLESYRNRTLDLQERAMQDREASRAATGRVVQQIAPVMQDPGGALGRTTAEALAQNPGADPEVVARLLDRPVGRTGSFDEMYPPAERMLQPTEVDGQRLIYNRKTGAVERVAGDSIQAVPVRDAQGNVIGNAMPRGAVGPMVRDPNTASVSTRVAVKTKIAELAAQRQAYQQAGNAEAVAALDAQIAGLQAEIEPKDAKQQAAPAAKPAAPAAKKGDRVVQGGRTFEWDGTRFRPVK